MKAKATCTILLGLLAGASFAGTTGTASSAPRTTTAAKTDATSTAPADTTTSAPQEAVSVPAALQRLTFLQGTPDLKASYYVYVQSASWCGPCRKYMPLFAKDYEAMRQAGVEVILVGRDSTAQATLAYTQKHGYAFPVLQGDQDLTATLPGFEMARTIPHVQVVKPDGTVLFSGHPHHFITASKWRGLLSEWKTAPDGSIQADMDDENGRYEVVVRNVDDMDDMLRTMAAHMRSTQDFQSRTPNPGDMALSTVIGNDIMAGYGISGADGRYTLTPAYLDSWRMLHAFRSKNAVRSVDVKDGGWGNIVTANELKALAGIKARLDKIVRPEMSEGNIILAIHDDLVNRATYRPDGATTVTDIYFNNAGGCEAYTRYMYLALNMAGITCHRVVGTDGFHHSWLLVQIDKKWYHLDTAWDDPATTTPDGQPRAIASHAYFCVSDEAMAKDHSWNRSILPAAQGDYPYSFRRTITSPQALAAALKQAYRSGAATFEARLTFQDLSVLDSGTCPIDSYAVTDEKNGDIVVIFDRTESGAKPVRLNVAPKTTDSDTAAARWQNIRLNEVGK